MTRTRPDLDLLDNDLRKGYILTVPFERMRDAVPLFNNMTISDEYRRAKTAMNNFEGGFMQRVSGAAVSASEAARNLPAYRPEVGDTPQDLHDKSERRRRFTDAVEQAAGPQGAAAIHKVLQESSDYLFNKQQAKEPVKINSPADALLLPPGQRFIDPNGDTRVVPRRRYGG